MLLFRSVIVGLLGACCLLLAQRPRCEITLRTPPAPRAQVPQGPQIIDVAPLVAPEEIGRLVRLAPSEHIVEIGSTRVASDVEAGALLARMDPRPDHYIDLTVAGVAGERRVLVLLH